MTKEELLEQVPKARRKKFAEEIEANFEKIFPLLLQQMPFIKEHDDIRERYARLKVPESVIGQYFGTLLRERDPELAKVFLNEDNSSGV